MATFVVFVDAPRWEFFFDEEHHSYHFEGRCTVRVFMYIGRPFAHPISSHRFTPTSPYDDDLLFERTRPRDEQRRRARPSSSAVRDYSEYVPLGRAGDAMSEDSPTHVYSEGSAPSVPVGWGVGSEAMVQQQPPGPARRERRQERRLHRGAHVAPPPVHVPRWATTEELRQFVGYISPSED